MNIEFSGFGVETDAFSQRCTVRKLLLSHRRHQHHHGFTVIEEVIIRAEELFDAERLVDVGDFIRESFWALVSPGALIYRWNWAIIAIELAPVRGDD